MSIRLGAIFVCLIYSFIYIGCSAKKDGFLAARDGRQDFSLPNQTLASLYPVPALNGSAPAPIDFVRRPRPQASFIGRPPSPYIEETTRLEEERLLLFKLGYNTNRDAALFIEPYQQEDLVILEKLLGELGFTKQEESLYVAAETSIQLGFYPSALLLSLVAAGQTEDSFALLDQMRRAWQQL